MKKLNVIVDVSGSMYEMGKPSVVGCLLATLSSLPPEFLEKCEISKLGWDGTEERLSELLQEAAESPMLLLTDGYALCDNCLKLREVREKLFSKKDSVFLVLCGGDAIDVSSLKDFRGIQTVRADNLLFAVESLYEHEEAVYASSAEGEEWK